MESALFYTIIFLVLLLILLAGGTWIGTTLGVIGIIFFFLFLGGGSLKITGYIIYNAWSNYTLLALPMFVFMATILSASGIGERLYSGAEALFSRFSGGLLHANIMACAAFGAVCGSTTATTATIAKVAMPYMDKERYPEKLATGSLLCAGGLGLMIPPSGCFIIYGALCDVSVGQLFMAGIFPGIILAFMFSGYIAIFCKITNQPIPTYKVGFKQTILSLSSTWPVLALFLAIMGAIFFGICTPTEASGVGVVLSLIISVALGKFNRSNLMTALQDGLRISIMIYFIYGGGMILAAALSNLGVPQGLAAWLRGAELSQLQLLIAVSIMYMVLGCVLDGVAAMVCTLPVIFPMIVAMGINPVWFGVIIVIYMEMAAITPPIGVNLFVLQGITGKPLDRIARGIVPFFLLYAAGIVILYLCPIIALFLPSLM